MSGTSAGSARTFSTNEEGPDRGLGPLLCFDPRWSMQGHNDRAHAHRVARVKRREINRQVLPAIAGEFRGAELELARAKLVSGNLAHEHAVDRDIKDLAGKGAFDVHHEAPIENALVRLLVVLHDAYNG